jgi:hypothetical protein
LNTRRKSKNSRVSKKSTPVVIEIAGSVPNEAVVAAEVVEVEAAMNYDGFEIQDPLLLGDEARNIVVLRLGEKSTPTSQMVVAIAELMAEADLAPDRYLARRLDRLNLGGGAKPKHPDHHHLHRPALHHAEEETHPEQKDEDLNLSVNHAHSLPAIQMYHAHGHLEDDAEEKHVPRPQVAAGPHHDTDIGEDGLSRIRCPDPGLGRGMEGDITEDEVAVGDVPHHPHQIIAETSGLISSGADRLATTLA